MLQRRQWHLTPALLPGKSHGQRILIGYSPWGHKESDTTEWLQLHFPFLDSNWINTKDHSFLFLFLNWRLITLQYYSGFCHTLTWTSHWCSCILHPEPPSYLPPNPIPQGHPSAPALSTRSYASNLDWRSISHMVIYMFQCCSLKSSHPHLLPQSPKVCSLHLCLFCSLAYRAIVTIFLNSKYMH